MALNLNRKFVGTSTSQTRLTFGNANKVEMVSCEV